MPSAISTATRQLYREGGILRRYLQIFRPFICPFHLLLDLVPNGSRVLDIGCGSGLFLGLLSADERITSGIGIDENEASIELANSIKSYLPNKIDIVFQRQDATASLPSGEFDVISLIDVMHHIPVNAQRNVISSLSTHLAPGGILLYKDMVKRPLWRAWANRLHDLVLAKQWIHYAELSEVIEWAADCGLSCEQKGHANMFWYGHEWVILKKE